MFPSQIDFNKISQALSDSLEKVKQDKTVSLFAVQQLELAQKQFQDAWSFNLSHFQ